MRACNHTGTQLLCPTQRQWFATQTSQHVRFCSRHGVLAWMAYASGVSSLRRGSDKFGVPWKQLPKDIPQRAFKNEAMQTKYKIL